MTIYGALQELTTFVIYRKQRMWAGRLGDPVLPELYRLIGRDEMAHARFYLRMVALHLADDRPPTAKSVLATTTAPTHSPRSRPWPNACHSPSGSAYRIRTSLPTKVRSGQPPASAAPFCWTSPASTIWGWPAIRLSPPPPPRP
jgi:hypothetical protein